MSIIFNDFIDHMGGREPDTIVTDQDTATIASLKDLK